MNANRNFWVGALCFLLSLPTVCPAAEWDHTVVFDTGDQGEDKSMSLWGMGSIGGPGVIRSGLDRMGAGEIDFVLIPFPVKYPLAEDGGLAPEAKAQLDGDLAIARLAGDRPLVLSPNTEAGIHESYKEGPGKMNTEQWVRLLVAVGEYADRPVAWVQPFNEPDYWAWGQGTMDDLAETMKRLKNSEVFENSNMAGPAVLNIDWGLPWFNEIRSELDVATMHTLNGSFDNYVDFIKTANKRKKQSFNSEVHNLVEVIVGAEYGLTGGIWWLACDTTRGAFVKACQGVRLAYEEDRERWSAAAVYRAPDGELFAFFGSNERTGRETTFRLICSDRDVWFNGDGPRREYIVTVPQNGEIMVRITPDES